MNAYQSKRIENDAAKYLFGKVESIIEIYARSANLSPRVLAHRVAELILSQEIGEVLGSENHLPALRRTPARRDQPVESMEMVKRPYRRTQTVGHRGGRPPGRPRKEPTIVEAALNKVGNYIGRPGFKYNGTHWTQTPKGQAQMRARFKKPKRDGFQRHATKGFSYQGRHWTQQPKNKARLRAMIKAWRSNQPRKEKR